MKRKFILSVDVEALPARAEAEHVERLIYGRFGKKEAAGIDLMMEMADVHGIPLTMYLDIAETTLYGDEIREVALHIRERGHDLQMHLHPELLPRSFWAKIGFSRPNQMPEFYTFERYAAVLNEFIRELKNASGLNEITSFRAGAFRIGDGGLRALTKFGVPTASNLSYESFVNQKRLPLAPPDATPFHWENGPFEIPITQIKDSDRWRVMALPMKLEDGSYEAWFSRLAEQEMNAPVVFILHSWSLLRRQKDSRLMIGPHKGSIDRYQEILTLAAKYFEPVSMSDYWRAIQRDVDQAPRRRLIDAIAVDENRT